MIQGLVQLFIFQALGELVSKFALPFIPTSVGVVLTCPCCRPTREPTAQLSAGSRAELD